MIRSSLVLTTALILLPMTALGSVGIPPPVAYWPFDGNPLHDASGNGNDLTATGDIVVVDGALSIDPSQGSLIRAPGTPPFHALGSGDMTAIFRVRLEAQPQFIHVFTKRNSCGQPWAFQVNMGTARSVHWSQGTGTNDVATTPLEVGVWHDVAFVRRAGDAVGSYLDGSLVSLSSDNGASYANGIPLTLGRDPGCGGDTTPILLDDVRLFDVALTPDQVAYLSDRTGPSIGMTTPAGGQWTVGQTSIPSPDGRTRATGDVVLAASVEDPSGVAIVRFYVNDLVRCVDHEAPYECPWSAPFDGQDHAILVEALDARGNRQTELVTVRSGL